MALSARAAQFSPFAALMGYEAAVKETARLTDEKLDLDDTEKAALNEKLLLIKKNLARMPRISITFFVPDSKKAGGSYQTTTGYVKKLQEYKRRLILADGTVISIDNILAIHGDSFDF